MKGIMDNEPLYQGTYLQDNGDYFTKHPLRFHSCVVCAFTKNMSSSCHRKLEKSRLHSGSSYFVFAVITKNAACSFCTHLVCRPSTFMSRTKVIITKFLLSKFSYVLYDLGFFDDIMVDEQSFSSSRSTSEKRKELSRSEEDSPQKR